MTEAIAVGQLEAGPFALRMNALRGTATYAAYLAAPDDIEFALTEIEEELRGFDPGAQIRRISLQGARELVAAFPAESDEILLIDARSFSVDDWALLDRRRSAIAHRGVTVFVMTRSSFDDLMRTAPNLASWLGGQVFMFPSHGETDAAAHRERRLAALRVWASRSDDEILEAARSGTLPPDPEYAEWLVLLGHGELLDTRTP